MKIIEMQPIHLNSFDPTRIVAHEHVDREELIEWLAGRLVAWLGSSSPVLGRSFCVLGDKGMGKSILTARVLADLQEIHSATTLFVTVDCGPKRSQHDVLREVGSKLVQELVRFQATIPIPVFEAARSFAELAGFTTLSRSHAHKRLVQYGASLDLGGSGTLAKWFESALGVFLRRSSETIDKLEGEIHVDGHRAREAFVALMQDITRHTPLRLILVLDNFEELRHEALLDADAREQVRVEVEGLLQLVEAPIALVLTMRTYYSSVLQRRSSESVTLEALPTRDLRAIVDKRLEAESSSEGARRVRETPEVQEAIHRLAALARTPLSFLDWTQHVLTRGRYGEGDIVAVLAQRLGSRDSAIAQVAPVVARLFARPGERIPAQDILAACEGNESLFRSLVESQVILPHNYWDPRDYYLDPFLDFLIPRESAPA